MGAVIGLIAGLGAMLVLFAVTDRSRSGTPSDEALNSGSRGSLQQLIDQSGIPRATVPSLIGACTAGALLVAVVALLVTAVPMAALIAGGVAAYLPILLLRRRAAARQKALRSAWPDAVDALVSAVRAGMSLPEAVGQLGLRGPEPLRESFRLFEGEYRATGSFIASLDVLQESLSDPVADRVTASLRIAREVGGTDLGTVLRTLSALLREDARTRGEIESRQSWTVSAARLAVAAPWITLALLCSRPEAAQAYASLSGALVLLVAAGMSFTAYRVMLLIGRLPAEPRMAAP